MIQNTYQKLDVISEIRRTLQIFKPEPSLIEIRSPKGVGGCKSGYFTNHDKLIQQIKTFKDFDSFTWYFVLNDINQDCYNLEQRDTIKKYMPKTTADDHITNREWLLIDCDPKRMSDIPSTNDEKQHAWNTLNRIYDFLQSRGFYEPVICDSGNGFHLLYRIDMPNTKDNTEILKNFLKLLDLHFTDEHVQFDVSVFNASRITKLYGSWARKGSNTTERPHRQSYIIQSPETIEITDVSLIKVIADMLPKSEENKSTYKGGKSAFDVRDFIAKHGIAVREEKQYGANTTMLRLEECPFNPEHKSPDSAVFVFHGGGQQFRCLHNSCSNNHWKEFRTHFEPDAYEKKQRVSFSKKASSEDGYSENDYPDFEFNPDGIETWEQLTDYEMLFELLSCGDNAELARHETNLINIARTKFQRTNDFKKILKSVKDDITINRRDRFKENNPNGLYFTNPPIDLNCNSYRGDDSGVYLYGDCVIPQPLLIAKQYEDIESGLIKAELAFMNRGQWKRHTVEREIIANKNKIISLANSGVMVTSDNASAIVAYLQALQTENPIPTQKSVSHLGYVGEKFIPYDDDIIYTGDTAYTDIYKAIHSKGTLEKWVNMCRDVRNDSVAARTVIISSFASVLIQPLKLLPYIVHLWGDSGSGKTVDLRLASSVWGEPDTYIRNLNSTTVGIERTAYFYHNFPLVLDELQTIRNDNTISKMIYLLTQGQGRTRGTIRGVDTVLQWRCAMITSGEQPLTKENSATGEYNRIIDIPVSGNVFNDPTAVYQMCSDNYGVAGRLFVENIEKYNYRDIFIRWETLLNKNNSEISGKHRMSIALLLTTDEIVSRMLFDMDEAEAINDTVKFYHHLSKMIITTAESDLTTRAYEFVCGWVAENGDKFANTSNTEQWGYISGGGTTVVISGRILEETFKKNGFNYRAVLKGLAERELSKDTQVGKTTKLFRLNNIVTRGIELILPNNS